VLQHEGIISFISGEWTVSVFVNGLDDPASSHIVHVCDPGRVKIVVPQQQLFTGTNATYNSGLFTTIIQFTINAYFS